MKTFAQVIEQLRDGNGYRFGHTNLKGHFYKAPHPSDSDHFNRDGAHSAITFWHDNQRAMPTLMLYDFDDDEPCWYCERCGSPTD